jgi:hypothetical protein
MGENVCGIGGKVFGIGEKISSLAKRFLKPDKTVYGISGKADGIVGGS